MKKCSPDEISLKSYFLGPQAENSDFLLTTILELLTQHSKWRKSLFPKDGVAITAEDQLDRQFIGKQKQLHKLTNQLSKSFEKEIPQFSPRYMGHMFSELSMPGLLGHIAALLHNPNNISKESSKVGLQIEAKAIQALNKMFGWNSGTGHITSGGTVANLEALLRMRAQLPHEQWQKAKLLTSTAAHYSWKKNLKILGLSNESLYEVPLDSHGRISTVELKKILSHLMKNKTPILGVVSLYGSTERGSIDDISTINQILAKYKKPIWHHVDAAYGGFYACVKDPSQKHLNKQTEALKKVTSLTLDPHKLGYVPYGCGAFLCRQSKNYFYSDVTAPYIQFKSAQEAGVQSVEGSRPATGAAATWLSSQSLGFHKNGLGKVLNRHLKAKVEFQNILNKKVPGLLFTKGSDLNILCWTVVPDSKKLSKANKWVKQIYNSLPQFDPPYFASMTSLPLKKHPWLVEQLKKSDFDIDTQECQVVRMTLMNPFLITKESQIQFTDDFAKILNQISNRSKV